MDSWQETNEAVRDLHKSLLPEDGKAGAEGASIGSSVSEANLLNEAYRLHPDIGTASQLAQPGGFRRAHVLASEPVTGVRMQYAEQPLVTHLEKKGFTDAFITEVVQQLPDGTQIRYESRDYRRGRLPAIIVEGELLAGVERAKPAHFLTWRPFSVSFWESFTILCGACLFLSGSVDWMTPIGDTAHGASEEQSAATVAWPYVCGGVFFLIGCYLALVEVINGNLQEEMQQLEPKGSLLRSAPLFRTPSLADLSSAVKTRLTPLSRACSLITVDEGEALEDPESASVLDDADTAYAKMPEAATAAKPETAAAKMPNRTSRERKGALASVDEEQQLKKATAKHMTASGFVNQSRADLEMKPAPTGLKWWGWQPHSLLYLSALGQFMGASLFMVACVMGLPHVSQSKLQENLLIYVPSVIGSGAFTFASFVFLAEVTHSFNVLTLPDKFSYGYFVALNNVFGSILYEIASLAYFVQEPFFSDAVVESASMWGVRFGYAAGSAFFVIGGILSFCELFTD